MEEAGRHAHVAPGVGGRGVGAREGWGGEEGVGRAGGGSWS